LETASDTSHWSLLACPRCAGALEAADCISCRSCGAQYPFVDGIPWLFAEPDAALEAWRVRMRAFTTDLESQAARYRAALTDEVARATTRSRLKLLAAACADHARRLRALLAPLDAATPSGAAPETYRALGAALPVGQGLTSYYANLHRDWCWGDAENEAGYRGVAAALGDESPGRTLVLGAGAGRLAYDVHARRRPSLLVAADLNPLMLMVARRMWAGDSVELYEFPVAPLDLQSHAVLRRLRAPAPAGAGLFPVFADVTRGPFQAGAFDTVITPWLIDILEEDLQVLARRLNQWLRPGGRWVNTGTLFFQHRDPARSYSTEEVREVVAGAGFELGHLAEQGVPYLASPASRHARQETVVTFGALRVAPVEAPAVGEAGPPWLRRNDVPVPLPPALASRVLEMRVHAFVASLVDGKRSVREIADVLVRERLMGPDEAEAAVREFLQRLFVEIQATQLP
jgi:uncharacterized protein YbaR (Trm112 family)